MRTCWLDGSQRIHQDYEKVTQSSLSVGVWQEVFKIERVLGLLLILIRALVGMEKSITTVEI